MRVDKAFYTACKMLIAGLGMWLSAISSSHAGELTDELSRCLVQSANDADRAILVRWMYTSMARHPAVSDLSAITREQHEHAFREMSDLIGKLLTQRCKPEAKEAIRVEGQVAIRLSFGALAQEAARDLYTHRTVGRALAELDRFLDSDHLQERLQLNEQDSTRTWSR